jgi:hypothetical protein
MKRNLPACRRTGRLLSDLTDRLVRLRLARSPGKDESAVRRDLWQTLREHAGMDDPNRLDEAAAANAAWVLAALLEMESPPRTAP